MAFAETQKLVVELDLKGNLNQKLGDAARALKGFDRATSNTQQSLSKFGRNLERGIVLGAAAAAGGFVAVAKAAGDFEAQMNTIATIVDRKDIGKIGEALRKTARDTGISLDDLTSAYYDLASAGIQGSLATATLNDAVTLGIGGLATTAETVNLLSTAINTYHLDAAGAAKATDQFALAIADGVVHADQIAATFSNVASVAKAYGVGIDQIATSFAFLTKQGVDAAEVTTEMQRAIVSLINPTKDLETAQKKLKINFTEEIRKKGLVPALQELRLYSDKTGIPLIALLGRIEAVKYTLQTTGPEFKGYNAELLKMGKASGVAAAQMAERQQGLNNQIAILKAGIHDAAITIGSELLPKLTPLIKKLNDFLGAASTQKGISDFGAKLADNFTKLADAIQKVDWTPFIDGLKLSGDIAKTVISAFRSLPEDLQKLVVAGFALNKVTGGLGTSIVKDLGGALLGNFAGRGSSPANPMWVAQVGGLGGAAGAAEGGLLGAIKSAAKWIVPLAVGVAVVELAQELNNTHLANTHVVSGTETRPGGNFGRPSPTSGGSSIEDRDLKDLNRVMTGVEYHTGKMADDVGPLAGSLRDLRSSFHSDLWTLIHATKALDVQKAAKKIGAEISKGIGNAANTEKSLGALQKQLLHTDDPKTRAVLKAQIARVERVLPDRQFARKEYGAVAGILKDGKITASESRKLKSIMQAVKDRGLPAVTRGIQKKVDEAKNAQKAGDRAVKAAVAAVKAATDRSTQATKDQDLSVAVNIGPTNISLRDVTRATIRAKQFGRTIQ